MNHDCKKLFWIIALVFSFASLSPILLLSQDLKTEFQNQLDSTFSQNLDAVGVLLHIESPSNNLSWTTAVGKSDTISGSSLTTDQPVLIASNTKPYVAAAILRLVELGNFELDRPIAKLIKRKLRKKFKKDGYDLDRITVRHLLSHTSGIKDYVDDAYFDLINDRPLYQWDKKEQIERSLEIGDPLFPPGTDYAYGDINYLLLTEIIEKSAKQPFYVAIKKLLKFRELGLNETWFKGLEPDPKNISPMPHQYSKEYGWDSYELNPSWDLYGGGGLAATVKDAALFFQYLFEGKIIEDSSLLEEMHKIALPEGNSKYGLGIHNFSFPNFTAYYHGGWWGTDIAYTPESNSTIAVFTLQKAQRNTSAKMSISMMGRLAEHHTHTEEKYKRYQAIIDSIYSAHPESVGIMAHIETPDQKISWSGGVGFSDKDDKVKLSADQPALIASSIKTYVAASILRLQELGKLSIEDPISKYLSQKTTELFKSDGYDFAKIKIKHVLSHTSGIQDYANKDYLEWIDKNQKHRWTRDEQLELTVKVGDPLGNAADVFSYADANFLLCTEMIENIWQQPFYTAMRELLRYEELGFEHTWFPTLEEANPETKALVHQYWGEKNWDSYEHDISWDLYGGGGIATTTEELAQFSYKLFNGEILQNPNVLNQIFTKIETTDGKKVGYNLGLTEGEHLGFRSYGHGGFWGTTVIYFPELKTALSVYVLDRDKGPLRRDITNALVTEIAGADSKFEDILFRPEYELYKVENSTATLVLFPGGASTAKETRREFEIIDKAQANGISVLLMNFNRHLWIDKEETKDLAKNLTGIFDKQKLSTDKVYIGGMSIGGNVALTLSDHLIESKSSLKPEGVFIVDSPIDLYEIHQSSVKDTMNPDLDEDRLAEPRMIIRFLESGFGQNEELLKNIQKTSPFTIQAQHINVPSLKNTKLRLYTEPDRQWWLENRQTDFEDTNAYMIQKVSKLLKENKWKNFELIETTNKGYRSNGERHPHSWSIVDIDHLVKWIKE